MYRPDSITTKTCGQRISGLLKINGITLSDIAAAVDPANPISIQAVSRCIYWETVSPRVRAVICEKLNLPESDLWPDQEQLEAKNRAVA